MYRVRRLGWITLMVADDEGRPIDMALQQKWRSVRGVGFVQIQHDTPHIVAISFDDRLNTQEKKEAMRTMIGDLPGSVCYTDAHDRLDLSESAWYE